MVRPLRDLHIWFTSPAGATLPTWEPAAFRNWDRAAWERRLRLGDWHPGQSNWGYALFGDVAYLYFGAWNRSQVRIEDVDAVIDQFRDRPGLIIDVRMNPGGDDGLALQVAGRFSRERRVVEYYRYRAGPAHTDFTAPQPRYLEPRGSWTFERPIAVLVGRGVFSSNETFASAMREIPHATLIGDTTGGATGNPGQFELGGGWTYAVPRWIAYTPDQRIIEWQGIPPDIVVPAAPSDFARGEDPVLDFALDWLAGRAAPRPSRRDRPAMLGRMTGWTGRPRGRSLRREAPARGRRTHARAGTGNR